mgnify:CR=1 FL=1
MLFRSRLHLKARGTLSSRYTLLPHCRLNSHGLSQTSSKTTRPGAQAATKARVVSVACTRPAQRRTFPQRLLAHPITMPYLPSVLASSDLQSHWLYSWRRWQSLVHSESSALALPPSVARTRAPCLSKQAASIATKASKHGQTIRRQVIRPGQTIRRQGIRDGQTIRRQGIRPGGCVGVGGHLLSSNTNKGLVEQLLLKHQNRCERAY